MSEALYYRPRLDRCGCPKPPGCYGQHGWHFRPDPHKPEDSDLDRAYQRCQAYDSARYREDER